MIARLASRSTPSLFSLPNRTTIVTGGGRGLGLTVVQALLESGSSVVALDLLPKPTQPAWDQSLSLAKSNSLNLTYHTLDVTNASSVTETFQTIFGSTPSDQPVRGLFCAAGLTILAPIIEHSPEQFKKVIDINLTGTFLCAQAFGREYMAKNPSNGNGPVKWPFREGYGVKEDTSWKGLGASVVLTGSMSGSIANVGLESIGYNASKAGVLSLARNFAMEWSRRGIRVNVSCFILELLGSKGVDYADTSG